MIRMQELTKKLNITRQTIYKWIKLGMPAIQINKVWYFKEEEVTKWIEEKGKKN